MAVKQSAFIICISALLLLIGISLSYAAPAIPHVVYGNATVSGQPAPAGTAVSAIDPSGKEIAQYTVSEPGKYGFLAIPGDDPSTSQDEGAVDSEAISFSINGITTGKSISWSSGKLEEITLSVQVSCRELLIESGSDEYAVPDEGILFGYVITDDCTPAENEEVEVSVSREGQSVLRRAITTDNEGTFEISFTIDSSYPPGTYTATLKHGPDSKSASFTMVSAEQPSQPAQETQQPSPPQPSQTPPAPQPNATANTTKMNQTTAAETVEKEEADEEIAEEEQEAEEYETGEESGAAQTAQVGNITQQPQPSKTAENKGAAVTTSIPRTMSLPEIKISFLEQFYLAAAALILVLVAASYLRVR